MSPINRRNLLLASAGLAGSALFSACSGQPASPPGAGGTDGTPGTGTSSGTEAPATVDPIKVGYIPDRNGTLLIAVAEQEGLWAKHGLDAQTVEFTNGPLQIQALGTGDLDFGYIGFGALWLPMSGQAKVVAIQSRGLADRVIAQPGITSIADLVGKRVGVPEGTSGDILLGLALKENGMSANDIERLAMDAPTTISAFASKQIDAAGIWYPHVTTIQNQVPDLVELAKSQDFNDLAFLACQVAAPTITERPEILRKFQAVAKEAFDWVVAHDTEVNALVADFIDAPAETLEVESQYVEVFSSDEIVTMSTDGTIDAWLTGLNEVFVEQGKIETVAEVSSYWLAQEYAQA